MYITVSGALINQSILSQMRTRTRSRSVGTSLLASLFPVTALFLLPTWAEITANGKFAIAGDDMRLVADKTSNLIVSLTPSIPITEASSNNEIPHVRHHNHRNRQHERQNQRNDGAFGEVRKGANMSVTAGDRLGSPQEITGLLDENVAESSIAVTTEHDVGDQHPEDSSSLHEKWCRSRGQYLPETLFKRETCAWCYRFVLNSPKIFIPGKKWNLVQIDTATWGDNNVPLSGLSNGSHTMFADHEEEDSLLHRSFVTAEQSRKWTDCCQSAIDCCRQIGISYDKIQEADETACPATWDGWQCWPDTLAGKEAEVPCPGYIYFETQPPSSASCKPLAKKTCEYDGRWYRRGPLGYEKEWSNYTTCSRLDFYLSREYVHIGTYAVSIAALLPALVIFNCYKQLRISRIILHQHLFLSLLMNAISVILFKSTMIAGDVVLEGDLSESQVLQNGVLCRILYMSTRYFRVTNYAWMLCEGFYLHKLVAVAFAQQPSLKILYFVGWAFPIIPVAIYAGLRLGIRGNEDCWIHPEENFEWTTNIPCILALFMNAIFLGNIIRVLLTKLRASHHLETPQYRKAVKAALVLVPLFGIHFILTMYRPPEVCNDIHKYYDYVRNAVDGLQGFLVAALFCYFNGEVLHLLRRSYNRFLDYYWPRALDSGGRSTMRGSILHARSVMSTHVASAMESPHVLTRSEAVNVKTGTTSLKPSGEPAICSRDEAQHDLLRPRSTTPPAPRWSSSSCARKLIVENSTNEPGHVQKTKSSLVEDVIENEKLGNRRKRLGPPQSLERSSSSVDRGYSSSHERIPMLSLSPDAASSQDLVSENDAEEINPADSSDSDVHSNAPAV